MTHLTKELNTSHNNQLNDHKHKLDVLEISKALCFSNHSGRMPHTHCPSLIWICTHLAHLEVTLQESLVGRSDAGRLQSSSRSSPDAICRKITILVGVAGNTFEKEISHVKMPSWRSLDGTPARSIPIAQPLTYLR